MNESERLYYAQHADRIVHLFDVLIVEEESGAQRLAAERELKRERFPKRIVVCVKVFEETKAII